MNLVLIEQSEAMSFANVPFPQVLSQLADAGVASYRADLLRLDKTYYDDRAASHVGAVPLEDPPAVAPGFDSSAVVAALRAIQAGSIGYADFLRQIMAGGCAAYTVHLHGRRAIYSGRDGDQYIETFPPRT